LPSPGRSCENRGNDAEGNRIVSRTQQPEKEIHMLVLSRRKNEQIVIQLGDETVVIRIVDLARDRVRLGISAPPDVTIHRQEVAERLGQWQESLNLEHADATV
jgi:carbon storage regulator